MAFKHAIALTWSISTGKSTTVKLLKASGFHIIDADTIAHQILDEQYQAIEEMFGKAFVKDGKVDEEGAAEGGAAGGCRTPRDSARCDNSPLPGRGPPG